MIYNTLHRKLKIEQHELLCLKAIHPDIVFWVHTCVSKIDCTNQKLRSSAFSDALYFTVITLWAWDAKHRLNINACCHGKCISFFSDLVAGICGQSPRLHISRHRIVGGQESSPGAIPWMVRTILIRKFHWVASFFFISLLWHGIFTSWKCLFMLQICLLLLKSSLKRPSWLIHFTRKRCA